MILDRTGTEFRGGRLILPKDWLFREPGSRQWWEPQDADETRYKIMARSAGGILLWQGVFDSLPEALSFWRSLHDGIGPTPREWDLPTPSWHPGLNIPGVTYQFATLVSYTTPGSYTWTSPSDVTATDYLVVSSGAGGGGSTTSSAYGGGGGAGGMLSALGAAVTPSTGYAVAVGTGGAGAPANTSQTGSGGSNSQFGSVQPGTGGAGTYSWFTGGVYLSLNAYTGGSGGGTGYYDSGGPYSAGSGTAGQGNAGSNYASGGVGGGGGGAGAAAVNNAGGVGLSNSITGAAVTYATGGTSGTGANGAANTGNGGGGAPNNTSLPAGNGGHGVVYLSYTPNSGQIPYQPWPQRGPILAS